MFKMEKAILKLLQGRVDYNSRKIPIIRRNEPIEVLPCITIEQSSRRFIRRDFLIKGPEVMRLKYNSEITISVWCNTEEQRNDIVEQIDNLFFKAYANHYTLCSNYDDGWCEYIDDFCQTLVVENGRSFKKQCPYPKKYHYENFFQRNNIIMNTFEIGAEGNIDDYGTTPPILRSIKKVNMDYYVYYCVGGATFETMSMDDMI